MCGIAGIIHRDGPGDIGAEMARMLQSMKHRGPDSSGFALYGPPSDLLVMRIKLADPNEARGFGWSERLERHRNEVEHRLAKIGAMVDVMHGDQEYAYRVTFRYSGELSLAGPRKRQSSLPPLTRIAATNPGLLRSPFVHGIGTNGWYMTPRATAGEAALHMPLKCLRHRTLPLFASMERTRARSCVTSTRP